MIALTRRSAKPTFGACFRRQCRGKGVFRGYESWFWILFNPFVIAMLALDLAHLQPQGASHRRQGSGRSGAGLDQPWRCSSTPASTTSKVRRSQCSSSAAICWRSRSRRQHFCLVMIFTYFCNARRIPALSRSTGHPHRTRPGGTMILTGAALISRFDFLTASSDCCSFSPRHPHVPQRRRRRRSEQQLRRAADASDSYRLPMATASASRSSSRANAGSRRCSSCCWSWRRAMSSLPSIPSRRLWHHHRPVHRLHVERFRHPRIAFLYFLLAGVIDRSIISSSACRSCLPLSVPRWCWRRCRITPWRTRSTCRSSGHCFSSPSSPALHVAHLPLRELEPATAEASEPIA